METMVAQDTRREGMAEDYDKWDDARFPGETIPIPEIELTGDFTTDARALVEAQEKAMAAMTEAMAEAENKAAPPTPAPAKAKHLVSWTAKDLLTTDFPETEWVITDLLPVGLAFLAGKPKLGKSWLALQMAYAVATGTPFLGMRCQQGPVMYIALEDSPARLANRMKQQGWTGDAHVNFVLASDFRANIGSLATSGCKALAREIEQVGYSLVVIDTFSRACPGKDQNDMSVMTAALAPIQEMSMATHCASVFIDHHGKRGQAEITSLDAISDILGSTAKGATCDTGLGLYRKRGETETKLGVVGRDTGEDKLYSVFFDGQTGTWKNMGLASTVELTENRSNLLCALQDMGASSNQELADAVGRNKGSVYRDMQELVDAGLVTHSGSKYRLSQSEREKRERG